MIEFTFNVHGYADGGEVVASGSGRDSAAGNLYRCKFEYEKDGVTQTVYFPVVNRTGTYYEIPSGDYKELYAQPGVYNWTATLERYSGGTWSQDLPAETGTVSIGSWIIPANIAICRFDYNTYGGALSYDRNNFPIYFIAYHTFNAQYQAYGTYKAPSAPTKQGALFSGWAVPDKNGTRYIMPGQTMRVEFDDGDEFTVAPVWKVPATPYINTGTSWRQATAYINNGETWQQYKPYI